MPRSLAWIARRHIPFEVVAYPVSALAAVSAARADLLPVYRTWGRIASPAYAGAAVVALALFALGRLTPRWRVGVAVVVVAAAGVAPMAVEIYNRQITSTGAHVQAHTIITEDAALALARGQNPYAVTHERGLEHRPQVVRDHFPYMPAAIVFGAPAVGADGFLADARIWFLMATLVVSPFAFQRGWRWRGPLLLAGLPPAAMLMVGGGHDLPVVAGLLCGLALMRTRPRTSAIAMGLCMATRQIALIPAVMWAGALWKMHGREGGSQALLIAGAIPFASVLPFLAWDAGSFVADTVLFPLDLSSAPTIARSPTIGGLLAGWLPGGARTVAVLLALMVAAWIALRLRRPPPDAPAAARSGAYILLATIAMAPTGRYGYLIYPLLLIAWERTEKSKAP